MGVRHSLRASAGTWMGTSRLWLPEEPTRESESSASVALAINGNFTTIAYTWVFDGAPQEGLLLIGYDTAADAVHTIFADSWHMGDKFMVCQGRIEANHAMVARGSYAVEGSPNWGWRIDVEPGNSALRIVMYNVSPEGEEFLGYELAYARTGSD